MNQPAGLKRILISVQFWIVAYVTMVCLILGGFLLFQRWAASTYGNPSARASWQEWRDDVDVQGKAGSSPVSRRVPKSEHPPATVLLFDYFWTCVAATVILSSVLFGMFMFVTRGVLLSPGRPRPEFEQSPTD